MSFAIDLDHALFLEKTTFLDQNIKMPGKTYKELYARRHMAYAFSTIWISKRTRERSTIGAFQGCMKLLIRL